MNEILEFLIMGALGGGLIALCSMITYEMLRIESRLLARTDWPARLRVLAAVAGTFIVHITKYMDLWRRLFYGDSLYGVRLSAWRGH